MPKGIPGKCLIRVTTMGSSLGMIGWQSKESGALASRHVAAKCRAERGAEAMAPGCSCICSHRYCKIAFHELKNRSHEGGILSQMSEVAVRMALFVRGAGASAGKSELVGRLMGVGRAGNVGRRRTEAGRR